MKFAALIVAFCTLMNLGASAKEEHGDKTISGSVEMEITGPAIVAEGDSKRYILSFRSTTGNTGLVFTPSVINGTIISQDLNPNSDVLYVNVKWLCGGPAQGNISITETSTNTTADLTVSIRNISSSFNFCSAITPPTQGLLVNQLPQLLEIGNCADGCAALYNFSYQWQVKNMSQPGTPVFTDIAFANSLTYQPSTFSVPNISYYRRKTVYYVAGTPTTTYSQEAEVKFNTPLAPGQITGSGYAYANQPPTVQQQPATGGTCATYIYEWELSLNGGNWQVVGSTDFFPTNISFAGPAQIRRKVICGNETQYSNILNFVIQPALYPGNLGFGGNAACNTTPVIPYYEPASGGLCSSVNYTYVWEASINNGPWDQVATTEILPATFKITGHTKLRRKVSCAGESIYSEVLFFNAINCLPSSTENLNYVRVNSIMISGVRSWFEADNLPTGKKVQSTTYYDGLGREMQKVSKQTSFKQSSASLDPLLPGNYTDMVDVFDYDALSRVDKKFHPYPSTSATGQFKTNALADQKTTINQIYGQTPNADYTYSKIIYEDNPLVRIKNIKQAGETINNDPQYYGISTEFSVYKSPEVVKSWNIDYNTGSIPVTGGNYPDNKLVKNITKDEKNKLVINYKDLDGNTVLKKVQEKEVGPDLDMNGHKGWLSTYYVYDEFKRLRYTITPKAVAAMELSGVWVIDAAMKAGLCFYQEYDAEGRQIIKHSPDAGELWMVYDNRSRLVLTQNENQRERALEIPAKPNQWAYSLFDDQDRTVATGLIDDIRQRAAMQSMVDNISGNPVNRPVELFTGAWETVTAYNPVAGKVPGTGYYCQSCTGAITNTLNYYDEYSSSAITFQTINSNMFPEIQPGSADQADADPFRKTQRLKAVSTGSKVRILDDKYDNGIVTDDRFLNSTIYQDERGRNLQTLATNIKNGTDVSSSQYDFQGKLISTNQKHGSPGNAYDGFLTVTKWEYDLLGRQLKLYKLNTLTPFRIAQIYEYSLLSETRYDAFGQNKTVYIGYNPSSGTPMEIQDYSYNIRGQLTGVNKEYALANGDPGNDFSSQWKRKFGFYLGYGPDANFGSGYTSQYNGSIAGIIWRSQGDNTPRKYNFEYDNINRFKAANFSEKDNLSSGTPWSNSKVDFSASISSYDPNGNITNLSQLGIQPGINGGIVLDNLTYSYYLNSNKLRAVSDAAATANTGKQGDFYDYGGTDDYQYDKNGNLLFDKNKNILDNASNQASPVKGILYNFLDKPQQITVKGKTKTEFIYDAVGAKLGQKVTKLTPFPPAPITTWYTGALVYDDNELKYIMNEVGRMRIVKSIGEWSPPSYAVNYLEYWGNSQYGLPPGDGGAMDYFLKDHLGNTRMILTDEFYSQSMNCSMEASDPNIEQEENLTFSSPVNQELQTTRESRVASGWPTASNNSQTVSKLQNLTNNYAGKVGPNAILRVMAGDWIVGSTKYYYKRNGAADNQNVVNYFLSILSEQLEIGINPLLSSNVKDSYGNIVSSLSNPGNAFNNFFNTTQQTPANAETPKAYLNLIFFDEQFRYVSESSGAKMIAEDVAADGTKSAYLSESKQAVKNGYVYIYVSNASRNTPVYFDDFLVYQERGPIVEDNAYYPHGLKIMGISSLAALKPTVRQAYQGDYSEFNQETGYNDFALRNYDPQLGRFIQADPADVEAGMYNGMGNDPVNKTDPSGGTVFDWFATKNADGTISMFWDNTSVALQNVGGQTYFNVMETPFENAMGEVAGRSALMNTPGSEIAANLNAMRAFGLTSAPLLPSRAHDEMRPYVHKANFGEKWDNFNQNPLNKATMPEATAVSSAIYDFVNSFKRVGSTMINNKYHATDLRGENILQKYGEVGRQKALTMDFVSVSSTAAPLVSSSMSAGGNYVYRSLTSTQAESLAAGKGIFARNPAGTLTLEEHLIGRGPKAANPWIATSTDQGVAGSFSSGNGMIRIDLSKIPANNIRVGWQELPRTSAGYHYSIWQQEVTIFGHIPADAIKLIK